MSNEKEIPEYPERIIQVNEEIVKEQPNDVVRETVEETLSKLPDQVTGELCEARKYEQTDLRKDGRTAEPSD